MEYRELNHTDISLFVEHRIEFVTLIANVENITEFKSNTKRYLEEHIEKDDLVIFIAIEDGKIVSSCMACIYQTTPLPSCLSGKSAQLFNVYTIEGYRKQGHAKRIVHLLIDKVKQYGVKKITLDYTDMGLMLYKSLGFTPLEQQMQLKI